MTASSMNNSPSSVRSEPGGDQQSRSRMATLGRPKRTPFGKVRVGRFTDRAANGRHFPPGLSSQAKRATASKDPMTSDTTKAGTSRGRMPENVLDRPRAMATAGLAKDVDA